MKLKLPMGKRSPNVRMWGKLQREIYVPTTTNVKRRRKFRRLRRQGKI